MVRFTDRELDIVRVLWDQGPCSVADVQAALEDELAYNTVLTMLRLMEEKGQVTRTKVGRAHHYEAAVAREQAGRSALARVRETLFRGSATELLLGLVDDAPVSDADLARMRDLLDERLRDDDEGEGSP